MPEMSEIIWENGGSRRKLFLSRKYLRETGVRRLLKYRKQNEIIFWKTRVSTLMQIIIWL